MASSANKTILKNTVYLYIRMILSMAVSLYTSRVILDVLGVSDFGLYNVIAGIIVLIALINSSMTAATQRFITYELGQGDLKKVSDTFSMSMTAHIGICVLVLLLGETIGLYYVLHELNIPEGRENAAFWVYQLSLLTVLANILRIPYNATVIAYEKMDFFAIVSILEVLLKLLIVYLLILFSGDKLIFYTFLVLLTTTLCTFIYKWYSQKKFQTCNYYWYIDKSYFKKLLGFLGWHFVGATATAGVTQIGNIIINKFCGTVINAAYGVASQVNSALNAFCFNFQTAYTPQIVKLYSQDKKEELITLMNRSSLLSYYLLFILAMPIFLYIDLVLGIWLKEVPVYTGIFCQWLIVYNLIDSVQAPLWKVITATGRIKTYEIWLSSVLLLNIPLTYLGLKFGLEPYIVVVVSTSLNLLTAIIRTIHVKIQIDFPITRYLRDVVLRVSMVSTIYIATWLLIRNLIHITTFLSFVLFFIFSILFTLSIILSIGLGRRDKVLVKDFIKKKFRQ